MYRLCLNVRCLFLFILAAESGKVLASFSKAIKLFSQCESGILKQVLSDIADRVEELSANQQKHVLGAVTIFGAMIFEYVTCTFFLGLQLL
jgi:hypothetical protein